MQPLVFTETQTYGVLFDVISVSALLLALFIFWRYSSWDAMKKTASGKRGSLDGTFLARMNKKLLFAIFAAPFIIVVIYFTTVRLETRIDAKGIQYQMFPAQWHATYIPWSMIEHAEVRDEIVYSRYATPYDVYSIADKSGLYIFLTNGKRLIIGTQKPDEVFRAIFQRHSY